MTTIDPQTQTYINDLAALEWDGAIKDDHDQNNAAAVLSSVKSNTKDLKAKKEAITKPLNAALKEIRSQFKPAEDKLANLESGIKAALLKYHERQEAAAQAEIDRIERDKRTKLETKMDKLSHVEQPRSSMPGAVVKLGPERVQIVDPTWLPMDYLYRESVLEALRKEVQKDVSAGATAPHGAKLVRERQVAGLAS